MTREIREMTNSEAREMIIRFKGVMADEFDISEQGINNFWHLVNQSMQLLQNRIQELIEFDAESIRLLEVIKSKESMRTQQLKG